MDDKNISQYINVLNESFKPAISANDATHYFSTDEIFTAIKELNPSADIHKDDIYQAMLDAGYSFKPRPGTSGIDFKWILIAR